MMVKRSPNIKFFPSAYVYPGGSVDKLDDTPEWRTFFKDAVTTPAEDTELPFKIAALREVFEETNFFVGDINETIFTSKSVDSIQEARTNVLKDPTTLLSFFKSAGVRPKIEDFALWSRWITPEGERSRFDTYFYLTPITVYPYSAVVDGTENTQLDWFSPAEALAEHDKGTIFLPPPQWLTMTQMSRFSTLEDLMAHVAVLSVADAARSFRSHVDLHRNLRLERQMEEAVRLGHHNAGAIQYQWFTQAVDHFNIANTATFQQRYLINDAYWNGKGPVFMMINGEGPMSLGTVVGLKFVEWAKQFGALIISLEHRYYGASFVTEDLSTPNMVYLSSQQALADNAVFRQFVAEKYNVQPSSKWVSFGGSYSGALTSWFRIKYPQLVDFVVASSAPVNAEIDFYQYLEVVQNSLLTAPNGQACVENIAMATQKIQAMIDQVALDPISDLFNLCPPLETKEDVSNFMQSLAGNFMGVVQYNLESQGPSVNSLCEMMTNTSNDPLGNYINLWNSFADGCTDASYNTMISEVTNTTNDANAIGGRMWFYQTCIEFGYYQTSTSTKQPFGDLFPIEFATQQCEDVFGFKFLPNVNWTHTDYGATQPEVSNVLYVNGEIDPWHALGITTNSFSAPSPSLLIKGTAHCADMEIPNSVSPSTLVPAQKVIESYLTKAGIALALSKFQQQWDPTRCDLQTTQPKRLNGLQEVLRSFL
eukprot:gene10271-11979_t